MSCLAKKIKCFLFFKKKACQPKQQIGICVIKLT